MGQLNKTMGSTQKIKHLKLKHETGIKQTSFKQCSMKCTIQHCSKTKVLNIKQEKNKTNNQMIRTQLSCVSYDHEFKARNSYIFQANKTVRKK